ncbi:hypothetical protein CGC21_24650 [Leishmania donovani]|uniref:Uncharacterized protein n=1 Tax=Leishmania donovani TaxID=5661 RepID=A0A504XUW8_LEIDO|nr:hypothetical protein CGC21_24650 [Leishmania donovani]
MAEARLEEVKSSAAKPAARKERKSSCMSLARQGDPTPTAEMPGQCLPFSNDLSGSSCALLRMMFRFNSHDATQTHNSSAQDTAASGGRVGDAESAVAGFCKKIEDDVGAATEVDTVEADVDPDLKLAPVRKAVAHHLAQIGKGVLKEDMMQPARHATIETVRRHLGYSQQPTLEAV